ncbi:hypothetical protein BIW11_06692 [Tropilaelaps mercedesae]|uniref:Uncharacterized protein n=1 Tax=Tropilaelaps mercedesae TaxID=418985 RepID=A0A1V9XX65_9ACAR|nr:hypothetical protein BIW11_06692 [Tropilaelaps mercedesae]
MRRSFCRADTSESLQRKAKQTPRRGDARRKDLTAFFRHNPSRFLDFPPTASAVRMDKNWARLEIPTSAIMTQSRRGSRRVSASLPTFDQPIEHHNKQREAQQKQNLDQQQPLGPESEQSAEQRREERSLQALRRYAERQRATEQRQRRQREMLIKELERRHVYEFMDNVLKEVGDIDQMRNFQREKHYDQAKAIIELADRPRTIDCILRAQHLLEVCPLLTALQARHRLQKAKEVDQAKKIRDSCHVSKGRRP